MLADGGGVARWLNEAGGRGRIWSRSPTECGSVLRVAIKLNGPRSLKVYRTNEDQPDGPKEWLSLVTADGCALVSATLAARLAFSCKLAAA